MARPRRPSVAAQRAVLEEYVPGAAAFSDRQVQRYYPKVAEALLYNEPIPTKRELEGHLPAAKIYHIERDAARRLREHYFLKRLPVQEREAEKLRSAGDLDKLSRSRRLQFQKDDIRRLLKEAGRQDIYHLVFKGYVRKYSGFGEEGSNLLKQQTAGWNVTYQQLQHWLLLDPAEENVIDLANRMAGGDPEQGFYPEVEWVDISSVSIPIITYDTARGREEKYHFA